MLAEEIFFFQYQMHMDPEMCMRMPIVLRRWMIERFVEQRESENKAIESQQRKARNRSR